MYNNYNVSVVFGLHVGQTTPKAVTKTRVGTQVDVDVERVRRSTVVDRYVA